MDANKGLVRYMATRSFYEDLVLDTPESVAAMQRAIDRADRGDVPDVDSDVRLCTDPERVRRILKG